MNIDIYRGHTSLEEAIPASSFPHRDSYVLCKSTHTAEDKLLQYVDNT